MNLDRMVFMIAGCTILCSLALGLLISPYWLALAAFVGFMMVQSSITGFCPTAKILKRMGVRSGAAFH